MWPGSSHVALISGHVEAIRKVAIAITAIASASDRRSRNGTNQGWAAAEVTLTGAGAATTGAFGFLLAMPYPTTPNSRRTASSTPFKNCTDSSVEYFRASSSASSIVTGAGVPP